MHIKRLTLAAAIGLAILVPGHLLATQLASKVETASTVICAPSGTWLDARSGEKIGTDRLYSDLAGRPAVLLGETHDNAEHHRWQLHTLAALLSQSKKIVIGFEMFPRRFQPVLDQWVNGELTEKAFLKAVSWRKTWGFDARLYMPLFDFARMHRIPMIALNVERELVSRVGAEGWNAIPADEREGLSNPANASEDYERSLAEVYSQKLAMMADGGMSGMGSITISAKPEEETKIDDIIENPGFKRFVSAQLTWDRAMAEGIVTGKNKHPDALIIGIMGSGHLAHFHGVPHQLQDLGVTGSAVLIPVEADQTCDRVGVNYADAVFSIRTPSDPYAPSRKMRLGVLLQDENNEVRVDAIVPDSVAALADLRKGDRVIRAAGIDIQDADTLVEVIARQAPGTWLPLTVNRSGSEVDLVAKFPAAPDQDS